MQAYRIYDKLEKRQYWRADRVEHRSKWKGYANHCVIVVIPMNGNEEEAFVIDVFQGPLDSIIDFYITFYSYYNVKVYSYEEFKRRYPKYEGHIK